MIVAKRDAHAKLNLFLNITGIDDKTKLHILHSLFLKLPLCDQVEVVCRLVAKKGGEKDSYSEEVFAEEFEEVMHQDAIQIPKICCRVEFDQSIFHLPSSIIDGENIVIVAARKFFQYLIKKGRLRDSQKSCSVVYGNIENVEIIIKKRIPIASGLAGGSADAAAVLLALQEVFGYCVSSVALREIGFSIGSDVVFALSAYDMGLVEGVGDRVSPAILNQALYKRLVVVNPGCILKTADVFRKFDEINQNDLMYSNLMGDNMRNVINTDSVVSTIDESKLSLDTRYALPGKSDVIDIRWSEVVKGVNDLTKAAITLYPELEYVLEVLRNQRGCEVVRMSGSGGTCFGIFKNDENAQNAAKNVAFQHPQWWVYNSVINNGYR
jgi:4-diphosphocytidyl-2-C-methyl-D-erythritol kinase